MRVRKFKGGEQGMYRHKVQQHYCAETQNLSLSLMCFEFDVYLWLFLVMGVFESVCGMFLKIASLWDLLSRSVNTRVIIVNHKKHVT